MGSAVVAKCERGFEASFLIGGGMVDFQTTCLFPCLCETCHDMVQVNLLAEETKCPKCGSPGLIPYDAPRLQGDPGQEQVAGWHMEDQLGRELVLTDGKYRCPKCGKMTLEFSEGNFAWD